MSIYVKLIIEGGDIMSENNYKATKDKVVGNLKEKAGEITNNEKLEAEGKIQKGAGEVREAVNDISDKAKVVTDKLVGSTKQAFDKFSDTENVDQESKLKEGAKKTRDPLTKDGEPVTDRLTGNPDKK